MNHVKSASQREALGKALSILGREHNNLVVLSPDTSRSTGALAFKEAYPERFICTGISEQNTMGMAAGLSLMGWMPVVVGFAMFVIGKAWESLRNSVIYPNLNVKIIGTHAGINVGQDGVSHQAIEDIALMRIVPGMKVLAPSDANQVLHVLKASLEIEGPVYIRLEREDLPLLTNPSTDYKIGDSYKLRDGKDATIFAIGGMVPISIQAAEILSKENLQIQVISMVSIKPLDESVVWIAAQQTGAIVVAEDHNLYGGLGSAIAELLIEEPCAPVERIAIQDKFAESGNPDQLRKKYHLAADDIVNATRKAISQKEKMKAYFHD